MMGIYLETFLDTHPNAKYLFTEDLDPNAPNKLNATYATALRTKVWRTAVFMALSPEASQLDARQWCDGHRRYDAECDGSGGRSSVGCCNGEHQGGEGGEARGQTGGAAEGAGGGGGN